jgi:hypothetical protein
MLTSLQLLPVEAYLAEKILIEDQINNNNNNNNNCINNESSCELSAAGT